MYYVMRASAPSLHRESTDSLIYIYIYYVMSRLIPSESEPVYLICELNGNYNY